MTREELIARIAAEKKKLPSAGPVHGRDLKKHIHRMQVELRRFDRYQKTARKEAS